MSKCKYCLDLIYFDDISGEEKDYCSCEKKNELDSKNYTQEYDSRNNEVLREECKYYLCKTCKYKKLLEEIE